MERSGYFYQCLLQDLLHAGGAIGKALAFSVFQIDRRIWIARRSEEFNETCRIRTLGRRMVFEVIEIKREPAVRGATNQLADLVNHSRASIASQAHDLVFVLVHLETEVRRKCRVQHSQRMWEPYFTQER